MLQSLAEYTAENRNKLLKRCSKREVENIIDADMPDSIKVNIINKLHPTNTDSTAQKTAN